MQTNANLIPNTLINWHFQSFDEKRVETQQLYNFFNLSPEKLAQPGALLEAKDYAHLVKKSIALFNDESFDLLNSPLKQGCFQLMTQACISCLDLASTLKRMTAFYRVVSADLNWHFVVRDDLVSLCFDVLPTNNKRADYFTAFMMSSIWRWLCWMIAKPIYIQQVAFNFSKPMAQAELSKVFSSSPIKYNKVQNKLSFSTEYLNHPIKQTPESLAEFLKLAPENLFSHYKENFNIVNQLKEHLEAQENIQSATITKVAKTFFLSEQTLMRKLRKEQTTFKEVKYKICKKRAQASLIRTEDTIEQIAFNLGFNDVSSFYKNFKRWCDCTPSQYRSWHKQG